MPQQQDGEGAREMEPEEIGLFNPDVTTRLFRGELPVIMEGREYKPNTSDAVAYRFEIQLGWIKLRMGKVIGR